jgi:hypothetical protein
MGRKRLQAFGFLMMFILFLMCGIFYDDLVANAIQVDGAIPSLSRVTLLALAPSIHTCTRTLS